MVTFAAVTVLLVFTTINCCEPLDPNNVVEGLTMRLVNGVGTSLIFKKLLGSDGILQLNPGRP